MSLSIITAVHNARAMNEVYWECLSKNTTSPFELILIDNHSTDGSEGFFRSLSASSSARQRVVYVRNEKNQSYPASQNQGMRHATGDLFCFLNNDLWLPPGWNEPIEREIEKNPFLVLSPSGQEAQPNQAASDKLKLRWRRLTFLSRIWQRCLGRSEKERLMKSVEWMYGDLAQFRTPTVQTAPGYFSGIKGDSVCFHRKFVEKLNFSWDERVEAADWHLYLTVAAKNESDPTIPLPRVLLDSYTHHFGRYSARQEFEPLDLEKPFLKIEDLWPPETRDRLWWGTYLPPK